MIEILNSAMFAARLLRMLCHRFVPGRRLKK
jgi:hypothetical protein